MAFLYEVHDLTQSDERDGRTEIIGTFHSLDVATQWVALDAQREDGAKRWEIVHAGSVVARSET